MNDTAKNGTSYSDLFLFTTKTLTAQRAEAILNEISHIIRKIHIGLISVLQGFPFENFTTKVTPFKENKSLCSDLFVWCL